MGKPERPEFYASIAAPIGVNYPIDYSLFADSMTFDSSSTTIISFFSSSSSSSYSGSSFGVS